MDNLAFHADDDEGRFVLLGLSSSLRMVAQMRGHYDFSNARKNPYAKRLKKQVTIRLDQDTLTYFRSLAEETEIPYQTLINLYLRDCAANQKRLRLYWKPSRAKGAA